MNWYKFITMSLVVIPLSTMAQKEKLKTGIGNSAYKSGNYETAISQYDEALGENSEYKEAIFNTGNAYLKKSRSMMAEAANIENPEEKQAVMEAATQLNKKAAEQFEKVASMSESPEEKNKSNFNLGNSRLLAGEIDPSIEAYKNALRNNPADEDARYNLAYAQNLKQQQEQEQQEQEQEQEQDDQEKDEKKEQDQNDQQENKDQPSEKPKPDQLTKEEAERMLDAMMNQEKDLQDKLNKEKHKAQRVRIEKDW